MFAALVSAIEELERVDPAAMTDRELSEALVTLRRLENRVDAAATRLTGAWDARRAWAADGARSGAGWLVRHTRMPHATAQRRIRLARGIRELPAVDDAWRAGVIESAHVSAICRARTSETAAAFARDEKRLLAEADRLRFDDFARVMHYWSLRADPDGAEADAAELREQRRGHLSQTFGGVWVGDFLLDPISGSVVATALREIEQEFFDADWADARGRVGDRATVLDLARTAAQRRADALVEMATRARTVPAGGRRPAPLFTVLVGYETFAGPVCELANGTALTPGGLVPWLTEADIERAVFDGPSRVIDVGVHRRLFDGATRRAIEIRDRQRCFHPTCTATDDLEVDHIEPWSAGGLTVQANGRLACGFHNRLRHQAAVGPDP